MIRVLCLLPFVLFAACRADETISGYVDRSAVWELEVIDGQPATDLATIQFPNKGQVRGAGPCNSYRATQAAPYPWIEITGIAATKKACSALALEVRFFAALGQATVVEVLGDTLLFSTDQGVNLQFRRQ